MKDRIKLLLVYYNSGATIDVFKHFATRISLIKDEFHIFNSIGFSISTLDSVYYIVYS